MEAVLSFRVAHLALQQTLLHAMTTLLILYIKTPTLALRNIIIFVDTLMYSCFPIFHLLKTTVEVQLDVGLVG
jgi:hypothetical protein